MNDCTKPTPMAYKCRFCQREGVAYYDATCDRLRLEKWTSMLCCNRCADFHTKRVRLVESIWATCYALAVILDATQDKAVRNEAMGKARERLNLKTRLYAKHICDFWNKMMLWEPDFVQMLLDKPRKCHDVLSHYQRGISGIK